MFDEQIDSAGPGVGMIREGERVDDLQLCGLQIIQKDSGFRFGMDAVLLSDFARVENLCRRSGGFRDHRRIIEFEQAYLPLQLRNMNFFVG